MKYYTNKDIQMDRLMDDAWMDKLKTQCIQYHFNGDMGIKMLC